MYKSLSVIALLLSTAACSVEQKPAPYVDRSSESYSRGNSGAHAYSSSTSYGGAKPIYSDDDYSSEKIESRPLDDFQAVPMNRNDQVIDFANNAQNSGRVTNDYIDREENTGQITQAQLAPMNNSNFSSGVATTRPKPVVNDAPVTEKQSGDYINLNKLNEFDHNATNAAPTQTASAPVTTTAPKPKLLNAKPLRKPAYSEAVETTQVTEPTVTASPVADPAPVAATTTTEALAETVSVPSIQKVESTEKIADKTVTTTKTIERVEKVAEASPKAEEKIEVPSANAVGEEAIEKSPIVEKKEEAPATGSQFLRPVSGKIVGKFGNDADGTFNDGIKIKADKGTDVKAADGGEIVYSGNQLQGYGNMIIVRHNNGYLTSYAHLEGLDLKKGAKVSQGQVIGHVGDTGNVSEPMLHFGVREGREPVDPQNFLK